MKVERPRSCRPPRYKVSPPGGVSLRSPHTPSPLTPPPPYPHPHDVSGTEGVRQDDDRLPAELLRGGQQGQDPQPLPRQLPGGGRAAAQRRVLQEAGGGQQQLRGGRLRVLAAHAGQAALQAVGGGVHGEQDQPQHHQPPVIFGDQNQLY